MPDIIDSRDLAAELEDLRNRRDDEDEIDPLDADERERLTALEELESEVAEWHDGATLVNDDHFTEYAQQLAEDIGAIGSDLQWPLWYIDWDAAADALKGDYTTVELDGDTYYVRA